MQKPSYHVGPLSPFEFENLKAYCESKSIAFEFEVDAELKRQVDLKKESQVNGQYDVLSRRATPRFIYSEQKFIYFYVGKEDSLQIVNLLTNLASPINNRAEPTLQAEGNELVEGEDYLCTKCDFMSPNKGQCPKHHVELLPYFDWLRYKKNQKTKAEIILAPAFRWLAYGLIAFLIGSSLYTLFMSFKK